MTRLLHKLVHYRDLQHGDLPNADRHDAKCIGLYTTEDRALQALARVADQPGFRDWPDGFRLIEVEVDRDHWTEGFAPGPGGDDIALVNDSSGMVGSDAGLAEYGDDESRDIEEEWDYLRDVPPHILETLLWELCHFKISARNGQPYEDMGYKHVGFYSSRARAEAAIGRLRHKPGFRDWPDGFRLYAMTPDQDGWTEGFAPAD